MSSQAELEMVVGPEDLARSLIREFFLKYNFKNTLNEWDKEDKHSRVKMTKIDLVKFLSMERLVRINKMKTQPHATLVEILTEYLFSKFKGRSQNPTPGEIKISSDQNSNADVLSIGSQSSSKRPPSGHTPFSISKTDSFSDNAGFKNYLDIDEKQKVIQNSNQRMNRISSQPKTEGESNKLPALDKTHLSEKTLLDQSGSTADEFKIESRRSNMKKVSENNSKDEKGNLISQKQSESRRNTQESSISFSERNSNVKNSDFFANLNDQNNKEILDPIFGSTIAQSKVYADPILKDSQIKQQPPQLLQQQQPPRSELQSKQIDSSKIKQQQESTISVPEKSSQTFEDNIKEKDDEKKKQFNFFGKKQPQKQEMDLDELEQMLQGESEPRFENKSQPNKKKIFEDDDDLDFKKKIKDFDNPIGESGNANTPIVDHLKLDLFDQGKVNFDFVPPKINFNKVAAMQTFTKRNIGNINSNEIEKIKLLLFSQQQNKFLPKSWGQPFILSENDNCFYGLPQKEGGPCGIIACVQAFFIKYLFFVFPGTLAPGTTGDLKIFKSKIIRENCLIAGIAEILFNARNEEDVIKLAVVQNNAALSNPMQAVQIESCGVVSFKAATIEQAYEAVHAYKDEFISQHCQGVTTILYSVILTKGVDKIISEMDSEGNSLIGHHGHCSQEQVNLFLTGKARSNCFDGEKVLDGDYKLKGIDKRSQFGFLTIFEHLKYLVVGEFLKTPFFPVWIVCKEYHYTVIFAKDYQVNERIEQPYFDVIYYDQLYNQEDQILLTVTKNKYAKVPYNSNKGEHFLFGKKKKGNNGEEDEDMIPAIEQVMRTKWGKEISVDWNGTQPIL